MTIQFFAPRHGRAPGQIEPAAQACSGSSSAYGRGSESFDDEQPASFGLTPEDILVLCH